MSAVALNHTVDGPPEGPPLLLGGSLGTTLAMWAPQVAALAVRHRVVAFDHRGHGDSPVPPGPYEIADLGRDVVALLDRLGLARVDYVGLSIGGMVGQWLGIHAPERVRRLVLICTAPDTLDPSAFRERAAAVRETGSTEPIADRVVTGWFTPDWAAAHPAEVHRHRAMIAASDPEGYAACCEAVASHDVTGGLARMTAPTLVVAGAEDQAIPAAQGERIAAAVPGARIEILSPAAHIASVEQADAVNRLIGEHLA